MDLKNLGCGTLLARFPRALGAPGITFPTERGMKGHLVGRARAWLGRSSYPAMRVLVRGAVVEEKHWAGSDAVTTLAISEGAHSE